MCKGIIQRMQVSYIRTRSVISINAKSQRSLLIPNLVFRAGE